MDAHRTRLVLEAGPDAVVRRPDSRSLEGEYVGRFIDYDIATRASAGSPVR